VDLFFRPTNGKKFGGYTRKRLAGSVSHFGAAFLGAAPNEKTKGT
jgi:hypothetical protein